MNYIKIYSAILLLAVLTGCSTPSEQSDASLWEQGIVLTYDRQSEDYHVTGSAHQLDSLLEVTLGQRKGVDKIPLRMILIGKERIPALRGRLTHYFRGHFPPSGIARLYLKVSYTQCCVDYLSLNGVIETCEDSFCASCTFQEGGMGCKCNSGNSDREEGICDHWLSIEPETESQVYAGQFPKEPHNPPSEPTHTRSSPNAVVPVARLDSNGNWGEFISPAQVFEFSFQKSHILTDPEELSIDSASVFIQKDWIPGSSQNAYYLCARGFDSYIEKEVFLRMTLSSQHGVLSFNPFNENPLEVYRCFENNPDCKPIFAPDGGVAHCFDSVAGEWCDMATFMLNGDEK